MSLSFVYGGCGCSGVSISQAVLACWIRLIWTVLCACNCCTMQNYDVVMAAGEEPADRRSGFQWSHKLDLDLIASCSKRDELLADINYNKYLGKITTDIVVLSCLIRISRSKISSAYVSVCKKFIRVWSQWTFRTALAARSAPRSAQSNVP